MSLSKISGMAEIADAYDLFVVDQWGVLHDGSKVHPGAVEALQALKDAGKTVVVLSNSGKPAGHSHERMEALGIRRALYDDVVTSGEDVSRHLAGRPDPFYASLGKRFFIFAWDSDRALTEGLDFQEVDRIEDADFVIAAGTDRDGIDAYRAEIEAARARDLPMICANPDLISVQPDGSLKMCPGAIAKAYEEIGGTVRWHGKPTRSIYELCFEIAGDYANGIGVGDSLLHDIKGAENAGLDSVFVINGIHKDDLRPGSSEGELAALANLHDTAPTFALCRFVW